jgi:hypothetical protein
MIRYRPASNRPGRKRPSFKENAAELGGRDVDDEAGCGDRGDLALAYSIVATSSVSILADEARAEGGCSPGTFAAAIVSSASVSEVIVASSDPTAVPQLGQNRLAIGTSALQETHRDMNFSADSVSRASARTSGSEVSHGW